jgi:hypothetical protein
VVAFVEKKTRSDTVVATSGFSVIWTWAYNGPTSDLWDKCDASILWAYNAIQAYYGPTTDSMRERERENFKILVFIMDQCEIRETSRTSVENFTSGCRIARLCMHNCVTHQKKRGSYRDCA